MNTYELWHRRLCQALSKTMHHVMRLNDVHYNTNVSFIDSCVRAKTHQLPFTHPHIDYTTPLQLVFVDI